MPDKHRHFAIVVKPVGSACNLRCHYCYYLDKQINYSTKIMSDDLLETYIVEFGGARNAMFRMKENWRHMIWMFGDHEKLWKKLRKCTDVNEYRSLVWEIFHSLPRNAELQADW